MSYYQALLVGSNANLTRKILTEGLQELALFKAAAENSWIEIRGVPGYERQAAPRWDFSSSGGLVNKDSVEFQVGVHDFKAGRLTLFLDGAPVLSGILVGARFDLTLPGRDRISIKRGTLNLRLSQRLRSSGSVDARLFGALKMIS